MKLLGSIASPFVRRIRILLHGQDYQFEIINPFNPQDAIKIAKYSPIARIPILIANNQVLWDSMLITKHIAPNSITSEVEAQLYLINELTDSGLQNFQFKKFDVDPKLQSTIAKNNLTRIKNILDYFENKNLAHWDIVNQWLFCTLDWFAFREIYPWEEDNENLSAFYKSNKQRPEVQTTDPRQQNQVSS